MTTRKPKWAAWSLTLLLLAVGCGGGGGGSADDADSAGTPKSMEELIAAAQEEGQLSIQLSGGQEPAAIYAEAFTEKYGIPVFVSSFSGNENWEKFQTGMEAGRPPADITIQTTVNRTRVASKNGWLEEYTPAADAVWPDQLKESGQWYTPFENGSSIAWSEAAVTPEEAEMLTNATNQELWELLVDPRWKDRVVIAPPHTGGSDEAWYYYVLVDQADTLGTDYLERIAALNPAILTTARSAVERMTAGEWAIFLGGSVSDTLMSSFYLADSPIRWRYLEPAPLAAWGMGIAAGAEHINAAKLWMEWMTSVEGQEALSRSYLVSPIHPDAQDTRKVANEPWFTPATGFYTDWMNVPALDDPAQVKEILYGPFEEIFDWTPEGG